MRILAGNRGFMARVIALAVLLTLLLYTIACSKQVPQGPKQTTEGPQRQPLPRVLSLATNPVGTLLNSMGTGLATVLGKYLGIEVKVVPMTGSVEWMPMISSGEVDLGILNNWDAKMGRLGKEDYKEATGGKGAPIYLLTSGTPAFVGVIVAQNSEIRNGLDLKGKRFVGNFTGSAGQTAQARAALANFGLNPSDVKMISVPSVDAGVRAIIEGRADAAPVSVGAGVITELDAEKGARFLSFDSSAEAAKRLQQYFPGELVRVEPGPGKAGVKEPVYLMSFDFYLVGSERISDDTAYAIVKTLWEHDAELGTMHARLKEWTKDRFVTNRATIPYHPGAVKFYKEVGVWGQEMDKLQEQLMAEKK